MTLFQGLRLTNPLELPFPNEFTRENCIYKGIEYEHNSEFQDDCDTCACVDGYVMCEKMDPLCQKVEID